MHGHGVFRVARGRNAAARAIAWLLRLPPPGDAVELRLVVEPCDGGERWLRTFGDRSMTSRQYRMPNGGIGELFGLVECRFVLDRAGATTNYRQTGAAIALGPLRIPLPRPCRPLVTAREEVVGETTRRVDVRIALPVIGTLLTYDGTIDMARTA